MKKLLIVEDTKVVSNVVRNEFKKFGYETNQAYTLKEAQNFLEQNTYNLIILDLHLPDGEGHDLIKQIKSLTDTKVVVLTASNKNDLREELFNHGIFDYIIKDRNLVFSINEIHKAIEQIENIEALKIKKKILVVDDSSLMRKKISTVLEARNYEVDVTEHAEKAFELIKKNNYDLITLDLELPDVYGVEFLEILKQEEKYFDIPVLVISGTTDSKVIREVYKKGGSDFIRKPFVSEEFILKVDFWIGYRQNYLEIIEQKDIMLSQQSRMAMMGEMLENIIHQSKQPLSVISSMASASIVQMQLSDVSKDTLSQSFDNIVNQVQFISKTMNMFRDFFKPKSYKETLSIKRLIDEATNLIASKIKNHEIQLINEIGDEQIKCYEIELLQVMLNLFSNTRDAFDEHEIEEKYIFIKSYSDESNVYIEFLDNAGGISKDVIDKIFDSHFSTKTYEQGSGIGLAMSKEIIEKHHRGTLEVESVSYEYNTLSCKGAKFTIKIPK